MGTYPFHKRRFARALAAEVVYRNRLLGEMPGAALGEILQREELLPEERELLESIVSTYAARSAEIEELLARTSDNWRPERMLFLDRAIIEAAIAELLGQVTPFRVVISEAIEITKAMSTEKSPGFVNGVLDRVARELGFSEAGAGRG